MIHRKAEHFEKTHSDLKTAWQENKLLVVDEACRFISDTQLEMWKYLYSAVTSYSETK